MYQKIHATVGPQLIVGKLERRALCSCGLSVIKDDVPLGTEYNVDVRSVRWARWQCAGCGKIIEFRAIDHWNALLIPQWTFLDLLDVDLAIKFAPKPANWQKVKDNKLAPAHAIPRGIIA